MNMCCVKNSFDQKHDIMSTTVKSSHNIMCFRNLKAKCVLLVFHNISEDIVRNFIKFINNNFYSAILYDKVSKVYYVSMFIDESLYDSVKNISFEHFRLIDFDDDFIFSDIVMIYYNKSKYASKNAVFTIKKDTFMKKLFDLNKSEYVLENSDNFTKYFLDYDFEYLLNNINKINAKKNIVDICKSKFYKNFRNVKISISKLTNNSFDISEVLRSIDRKNKNNVLLKNRLYYITIYKYIFYIKSLYEVYSYYNIDVVYDLDYVKQYIINFLQKYVKSKIDYDNYVDFVNYLFDKHVFYKYEDYVRELINKYAVKMLRTKKIFVSLYLKNNRRLSYNFSAKNYFVKNKRLSKLAFIKMSKNDYNNIIKKEKVRKVVHFVVHDKDYVTLIVIKKYIRRIYKFFSTNVNECYYVRLSNKLLVQKNVNNNFINIKYNDFIVELYKLLFRENVIIYNNSISTCKSLFNKSVKEVSADEMKKMLYKQKYLYLQNEQNKHDYLCKIMYIYSLALYKKYDDVIKIFEEDFMRERTYVSLDVMRTFYKYSK